LIPILSRLPICGQFPRIPGVAHLLCFRRPAGNTTPDRRCAPTPEQTLQAVGELVLRRRYYVAGNDCANMIRCAVSDIQYASNVLILSYWKLPFGPPFSIAKVVVPIKATVRQNGFFLFYVKL